MITTARLWWRIRIGKAMLDVHQAGMLGAL
jgi:hypothetical protein